MTSTFSQKFSAAEQDSASNESPVGTGAPQPPAASPRPSFAENGGVPQEKLLHAPRSGVLVLLLTLLVQAASCYALVRLIMLKDAGKVSDLLPVFPLLLFLLAFFAYASLRIIKPQEAKVLMLFGNYYGTLRGPGFFVVNPFVTAYNPAASTRLGQSGDVKEGSSAVTATENDTTVSINIKNNAISLKRMTLNNARQKVNDVLGNPVEIGVAVIWRVVDTAKAVFSVYNYKEYLSLQCDAALRDVVRIYPYDVTPGIDTTGDGRADEGSLRGSSQTVAERIKSLLQEKVREAGLEILDTRITYLAYAPEIASAMLRRQQASAVIDARTMIVEGAVSMVEMALKAMEKSELMQLDNERRAQMVSNLMLILCGNQEAQPVINAGSLY